MLRLKLQYFGHLMRTVDSLKKTLMLGKTDGRRRRRYQRMRWQDSITNAMDMNLGKLQEMARDREAWSAAVHGIGKSRTLLGDWTQQCKSLRFLIVRSYESGWPLTLELSRGRWCEQCRWNWGEASALTPCHSLPASTTLICVQDQAGGWTRPK